MSSEACREYYQHMLLFRVSTTGNIAIATGNDFNIEKSCFQDIGNDRPKFTIVWKKIKILAIFCKYAH